MCVAVLDAAHEAALRRIRDLEVEEEAFKKVVDHVTAVYPHTLIFHLRDGREEKREWQNRSRAESWTPEMKEKAREAARRKNDGKNRD